jgi:DNA-binding transcriptional MerR regulator
MSTERKRLQTAEEKIAYTEAEAAEILGVATRTLANYRRGGKLKGNYAVFGRNVLYTPEHIRRILEAFTVGRKAA